MHKINALLFCFLMFFSVALVSAEVPSFSTNFVKWTMCDQFNLTKWDCDSWWESDTNPYYVKPTATEGLNETELSERYYNKSQVKDLLNTKDLNTTEFYNKSEVDTIVDGKVSDLKKDWLNNQTEKFVTRDEYDDDEFVSRSNGSIDGNTVLVGLLVVGAIFGGLYMFNNKNKSRENLTPSRPAVRRIHTNGTQPIEHPSKQASVDEIISTLRNAVEGNKTEENK